MDNMAHMKVCGFLDTAWIPDYEKNPRESVKFLRAVSIERDRMVLCPIINKLNQLLSSESQMSRDNYFWA